MIGGRKRLIAELQAEVASLRADLWELTGELIVLQAICVEQEAELLRRAS